MSGRTLAWLLVTTLVAGLVLAGVHVLTRGHNDVHAEQRAVLAQVLPAASHDNDPFAEEIRVQAPNWLGSAEPLRAWRARRGGAPVAVVLEAVAPNGYAGPIHLLVAVDRSGAVMGVHVTRHRETPGLGDRIERRNGGWLDAFTGRTPSARWAVKRDGGDFDQIAGATITSRAVVDAVWRVLQYVARHREEIENAPAGSLLEHHDAPDA